MNVTWYVVQAANENVQQYTYTSEQPPVEADEYARVCAEAADLRRQLAELTALLADAAHADLDAVANKIDSDLIAEVRRQLDEAQTERNEFRTAFRQAHATVAELQGEAADLRRQLAECQVNASAYLRGQNQTFRIAAQQYEALLRPLEDALPALQAENADLRRQLDAIRTAMHGYADSDLVSLATTLRATADASSAHYEAMLDACGEAADLRRQLAEARAQLAQRDAARVAEAEDYPELDHD